MSARIGAKQHNIILSNETSQRLEVMAKGKGKGKVVEDALIKVLGGDANEALVRDVQQQVSAYHTEMLEYLHALTHRIAQATTQYGETNLKQHETLLRVEKRFADIQNAYEVLVKKIDSDGVKPGVLGRFNAIMRG